MTDAPDPRIERPACAIPPEGWFCTRKPGHDAPCAALPDVFRPVFRPLTREDLIAVARKGETT